jgi:hypothetical protein
VKFQNGGEKAACSASGGGRKWNGSTLATRSVSSFPSDFSECILFVYIRSYVFRLNESGSRSRLCKIKSRIPVPGYDEYGSGFRIQIQVRVVLNIQNMG